jgi:hypothetical protein
MVFLFFAPGRAHSLEKRRLKMIKGNFTNVEQVNLFCGQSSPIGSTSDSVSRLHPMGGSVDDDSRFTPAALTALIKYVMKRS